MKHLKDNGYSYSQHLKLAFKYGFKSFKVGFKLIIHGIFPFIWEDTGWKKLGKP